MYGVTSIENNFDLLFPGAKAPAAPDALKDGTINAADATYILQGYAGVATGEGYIGSLGSKDGYEWYNN